MEMLKKLVIEEDGPTAVEYAVMLALILVACISVVAALGQSNTRPYSQVHSTLSS